LKEEDSMNPRIDEAAPRLGVPHAAALLLALAALALPGNARAGVSYDVSVGLPVGDDARVFLNVTNEYYAPPQEIATAVIHRCPHPEDDYPVVLFLARASGRPPVEILDMRLRGMAWADIMFGLHVRPSVLFVGVDADPGPPYGRAWGYWRNHPQERLVIEDREFVELTKVQVASAYYHVSPRTVIRERQRGVTVERFVVNKHGAKAREHGGDRGRGHGHGHGHGQGEGQGPGEGHGHGHGKPDDRD
jgi:hypothetical protein